MISYENAKEIIEILTKNTNLDTVSWFKFWNDESEQKNAIPEPPEVECIYIKYFGKHEAGVGSSAPIATIDIDVISAPCFSLNVNDFAEFAVDAILTNVQSVHNWMRLKLSLKKEKL